MSCVHRAPVRRHSCSREPLQERDVPVVGPLFHSKPLRALRRNTSPRPVASLPLVAVWRLTHLPVPIINSVFIRWFRQLVRQSINIRHSGNGYTSNRLHMSRRPATSYMVSVRFTSCFPLQIWHRSTPTKLTYARHPEVPCLLAALATTHAFCPYSYGEREINKIYLIFGES